MARFQACAESNDTSKSDNVAGNAVVFFNVLF